MQHAAAVAQTGHALVVEQVGVDTRCLRRDVGAHPQGSARKLVNQLEGAQIQIRAGTGQQGLQILQRGRHDVFVAATAKQVEHRTPRRFDPRCLGRQGIGNGFR